MPLPAPAAAVLSLHHLEPPVRGLHNKKQHGGSHQGRDTGRGLAAGGGGCLPSFMAAKLRLHSVATGSVPSASASVYRSSASSYRPPRKAATVSWSTGQHAHPAMFWPLPAAASIRPTVQSLRRLTTPEACPPHAHQHRPPPSGGLDRPSSAASRFCGLFYAFCEHKADARVRKLTQGAATCHISFFLYDAIHGLGTSHIVLHCVV